MAVRNRCDRCAAIARVESSTDISPSYKKLYCACKNPECGHTWVMDLTYSHTLSPSALDLPATLLEKIRNVGCRQEQRKLYEGVGG